MMSTFASMSAQFQENLKKAQKEAKEKQFAMPSKNRVKRHKVTSSEVANTVTHFRLVKTKTTNFASSLATLRAAIQSQSSTIKPSFGFIPSTTTTTTKSVSSESNEKISTQTPTTGGFGDAFKPKPVSWICQGCYLTNPADSLYCNACAAPKDEAVPKKDATTNIGVSGRSLFGSGTSTTNPGESIFGGFDDIKYGFRKTSDALELPTAAPNSSSKDSTCSAHATTTKSIIGGKSTTSSSKFRGKPVFGRKSTFGSSAANDTSKSIFGSSGNTLQSAGSGTESSLFSSSINTTGFGGSIFGSSSSNLPQFDNLTKEPNPFGTTFSNLSKPSTASTDFGNLIIKSNSNASQTLDKTSTTFGDLSKAATAPSDASLAKSPAIELPNKIIFSTAEEEETKLFGEIAFLFRWDATTKQTKESGVGELKILLHPVKQSYRLVMRCMEINKLVLHHPINADFHFDNTNNNSKSLVWETKNYAELNEERGGIGKIICSFLQSGVGRSVY